MRQWQWFYAGRWLDCSQQNQQLLEQRHTEPTVDPLCIVEAVGEISGNNHRFVFRVHGDDQYIQTLIRKGPSASDGPIFAANGKIIPRVLFKYGKPSKKRIAVDFGTEHWVAEKNKLYEKIDGVLRPLPYLKTDISKWQCKERHQTRFQWEFNGSFRCERMRKVVASIPGLQELYDAFDPTFEAMEHGAYQFNDFLSSRGHDGFAVAVMEKFYAQDVEDWRKFGADTNAKIERARESGLLLVSITARGHDYVLVFDSGGGASGQPPVLIRPGRYELILSSIEENVSRHAFRALFAVIEDISITVPLPAFIRELLEHPQLTLDRHVEPALHPRLLQLVKQIHNIGATVATQLQSLLPSLLEKYKECDIRQSTTETLTPKRLEAALRHTLMTGLRSTVPFPALIRHIRDEQCWTLKPGTNNCDICQSSKMLTLGHCGSAGACLKCWVDSLCKTNMSCPFCRTIVKESQLILKQATQTAMTRKRKRTLSFNSEEEILSQIRKIYTDVKLEDSESMRKWFTILLRTGVIQNGQLPTNLQAKKSLRHALHDLNLLG